MTNTTVTALVITAGLTTMAIGCADDSSSHRSTVRQSQPSTVSSPTSREMTSREMTDERGMADSRMRSTPRMTDGNILALLEAVNMGEVQEGKLAQQRAASPDVRLYANRMAQEHQMLLDQSSNLASRLNITPALPQREQDMATGHKAELETLKTKSGREFDKAYLEHNIQMHEDVLKKLDDATLEAQHQDVRTLLAQVRPGFQAHLKSARDLRRNLTPGTSGM